MRIVLDTNVFISGIFFSGPPARILEAWRDGKIELAISPDILNEYQRVAHELSRQFPSIDLGPVLGLITIHTMMFHAPRLPDPV